MKYEVRSMNNGNKILKFRDLNAWKEGHKLVLMVYLICKTLPSEEKYALGDQIRRAAISITSNIAEGFSRQSLKEKVQFYSVALGSTTELQNQLLILKDTNLISPKRFMETADQSVIVHKLINGLIKSTKKRIR